MNYVVIISFYFQPCSSVWNHSSVIKTFTCWRNFTLKIYPRRTHDLRNNNTFGTVHNKGTFVSHRRDVSDINFLFLNFTCITVYQTHHNTKLFCICSVMYTCFFNCIFRIIKCIIWQKVQL